MKPQPLQPLHRDRRGVIRFRENAIVRRLLDVASAHGYSLNQIAVDVANGRCPVQDERQLAQLIGYSVSGYGELSYVSDAEWRRVEAAAESLAKGSLAHRRGTGAALKEPGQ